MVNRRSERLTDSGNSTLTTDSEFSRNLATMIDSHFDSNLEELSSISNFTESTDSYLVKLVVCGNLYVVTCEYMFPRWSVMCESHCDVRTLNSPKAECSSNNAVTSLAKEDF